jgi:geranylgeranyl pyrophosphate synthase
MPHPSTVLSRCYTLAASAEMIHAASLMHDDVVDGSLLRRGRPSAHAVFGQNLAVRGGDAVMAVAARRLAELNNADVS